MTTAVAGGAVQRGAHWCGHAGSAGKDIGHGDGTLGGMREWMR
jgi:hypothetical protein